MTRIPATPVLIIATMCMLLVAGCTSLLDQTSQAGNTTPAIEPLPASYKVTIAQPDGTSRSIRMDTDVYNLGEVVEFYVINEGPGTLACSNTPPAFSVKYQAGSGKWITRMGAETPSETNKSSLEPGESLPVYRFITTGWEPNRYRIVSDCGVYRDFLIRPVPTPVPTICPQNGNASLWVRINPIGDQYAGKKFSISGTTNQVAGAELKYLVFPIGNLPKDPAFGTEKPLSTRVSEGVCGENTWSVDQDIRVPQEYYIMISAGLQNATAIRRFTLFAIPPP